MHSRGPQHCNVSSILSSQVSRSELGHFQGLPLKIKIFKDAEKKRWNAIMEMINRSMQIWKTTVSVIFSQTIHLRISSLHLKKYCQLGEDCVCWPAAVISAEHHPHHRPRSNDSPRCLQRRSPGRGRKLMDPSFILPSGSKVTPVSAASKQGNGKLFTFTAAGWNQGVLFWA